MEILLSILGGIGLLLIVGIYAMYVSVIQKKNKVQEALSSIDVQLKKRYDLIPNILKIAQKFMDHERSLLEDITNLRTQALQVGNDISKVGEKINLDKQIAQKMGQVMVAVENYPDLKSDETMVTAQKTYNEVEEHIAASRRFYNAAALDLKNCVEIFPTSLIAGMLGVRAVDFFQVEEHERQSIDADSFLK